MACLSAFPSAQLPPAEAQREPARAAGCGGVVRYAPLGEAPAGRPPLAIGDSIMLGAVEPLRRRGFEVDVRGCRQMSEGLRVLAARARRSSLPDAVVIALGTNWTVERGQVRSALRLLGRERVLGLVTPRETGGRASTDQEVIRAAGRRWPGRVRVIDWVAHSQGRTSWFGSDGLHLTTRGARALAKLVSTSLAQPEREPPEPPSGGGQTGGGISAPPSP